MSLSTAIVARVKPELATDVDHGTTKASLTLEHALTLANGTGSSQADRVFSDQRTLTASATETLDLTSLTGPLGDSISFAKVKAIMIKAAAGNTNNVVVGAAASNAFVGPFGGTTPTLSIPPGGSILLLAPVSGWAVANGSTDNLKIANSAGSTSVTYDITIIGTSA